MCVEPYLRSKFVMQRNSLREKSNQSIFLTIQTDSFLFCSVITSIPTKIALSQTV